MPLLLDLRDQTFADAKLGWFAKRTPCTWRYSFWGGRDCQSCQHGGQFIDEICDHVPQGCSLRATDTILGRHRYPVRPAKTWNEITRCLRSWLRYVSRLRSFHCHQVRSKRERHLLFAARFAGNIGLRSNSPDSGNYFRPRLILRALSTSSIVLSSNFPKIFTKRFSSTL